MAEQKKISRERRKSLLKRLKQEIGPYKVSLYKSAFLGWIQFVMRIVSFYIIAQNIERLYRGQDIHVLNIIIQLIILNGIGYAVAHYSLRYQGGASQYARNNLKRQFFGRFQARQGYFSDKESMADILTIASQGIDSLDTYFQHYLSISFRAYLNCTTVLLLVGWIYPIGGIIFILSLPLIPISIILMQKRSKKIMNHYWSIYMDVGNLFIDNLRGLNTLYTYGADEQYANHFTVKAEEFRKSTMDLLRFQLESVGYMDGVMYLGVGISGFAAASSLATGSITIFALVFFVLIAAEFFAPIREMGYGMHLVMMNTKMADRIYHFLDSVDVEPEGTTLIVDEVSSLQIHQLGFHYDTNIIFNNLSLTIHRGELFAIAGESGLGKTTLAKLIQNELRPQQGTILFDHFDISKWNKEAINNAVMYVSQANYLFNQSIYQNIVMAKSLSKEAVSSWIKERNLLPFISQLPDGLDTIVGENGMYLSPGQRQQVICVQALIANKPIYIFDEMTSSVDSESEQIILEYMKLTAQKSIVLFISHKMKQIVQAHRVLFLDSNRKTIIGTPKMLLAENAEFNRLIQTQEKMEAILNGR